MFERIGRWTVVALVISLAACTAPAAEKDGAAGTEEGYVSLFNGKDLTGWDGHADLWKVADGVIRGETTKQKKAPGNTFLIWKGGTLKNFVLKLKFRVGDSNNSGVQFRSVLLPSKEGSPNRWVVKGYQVEVQEKPGKVGFLYDEKRRGWLVNVGDIMEINAGADGKIKKEVVGKISDAKKIIEAGYYKSNKDPEAWNEYTITCRGNHTLIQLNGYQTVELIDNDMKDRTLEGVLALQIHGGAPMKVEFKDIRLKELTENYGEAFRLVKGGDLTGFAFSSEKMKDAWTAKDGVLSTTGKPSGYIRTEKDYTNYVLRVQLRHTRKCNSGVLVRMTGADKVWPKSIEAQGMKDNMGDIFNIDKFTMKTGREKGRRTVKLHPSNENPLGEWNQYDILMNKGDLVMAVNGLVQNIATECEEVAGKICFQSEGGPVDFRNIVLIPILPDAAKKE